MLAYFFICTHPLGSVGLEETSSWFAPYDLVCNMYAHLVHLCVNITTIGVLEHLGVKQQPAESKSRAAPCLNQGNVWKHCAQPQLEAAELTHSFSRNTAERKQEEAATGQDSTQEIKVLLLFKQLELDEDVIFPKDNGIGVGGREVPQGENIAVPN